MPEANNNPITEIPVPIQEVVLGLLEQEDMPALRIGGFDREIGTPSRIDSRSDLSTAASDHYVLKRGYHSNSGQDASVTDPADPKSLNTKAVIADLFPDGEGTRVQWRLIPENPHEEAQLPSAHQALDSLLREMYQR